MKQDKGFTLIELLAVIVILAVIALIATPLIMGTITKAKINAMKDSMYGIVKSGETYLGELLLNHEGDYKGEVIDITDKTKLKYKGQTPEEGSMRLYPSGSISLYAKSGVYCYIKRSNQSTIEVILNAKKCDMDVADNLVKNGYGEYGDNTNFPYLNYTIENSINYFRGITNTEKSFMNSDYISVNPSKTYYQEVSVRTNKEKSFYYMGFTEYDIDKKEIVAGNVAYVPGSLTTLAHDLNPGDTVVYFNNLSHFKIDNNLPSYKMGLIFWDYKDSTGYLYPSETYSRTYYWDLYTAEQVNRDNHIITLKRPWAYKKIDAGTKVSQSDDGLSYNYGLVGGSYLSVGTWKTYHNTITGITTWPKQEQNKFRHGTRYIRFLSVENYKYGGHTAVSGLQTDYRNFIFKEISA